MSQYGYGGRDVNNQELEEVLLRAETEKRQTQHEQFTPHELAFVERSAQLRREYLCSLLQEVQYHPEVRDRCFAFKQKYHAEYESHRRRVHFEDHFEDDWSALTFRQQCHIILEYPFVTNLGRIIAVFQVLIVIASMIVLLIETDVAFNPTIHMENEAMFWYLETFFTVYFSLETAFGFYVHPDRRGLMRSVTFYTDVASCLPMYITIFVGTMTDSGGQVDAIRMMRLFRLVRFLRIVRAVRVLIDAVATSLSTLVGPLCFLFFFVTITACIMFYAERGAFDSESGDFTLENCFCTSTAAYAVNTTEGRETTCGREDAIFSLGMPISLWWGIVTSLTVGYGTVVPICDAGKGIAVLVMIMSTITMAMPIAVMGSAFTSSVLREKLYGDATRIFHAQLHNKQHQKLLQVVVSRRLHEVREEKLAQVCRRYHLNVGTQEEMVRDIYTFFGMDPNAKAKVRLEVPVVMSLAESLFTYIKARVPVTTMNMWAPCSEVIDVIDCFFERIFAWQTKNDNQYMNLRLESLDYGAAQAIIPLYQRAKYTIGISVEGIADPDIVIPMGSSMEHPAAAMGARMATIEVFPCFGVVKYVVRPHGAFVPFLNNKPVPKKGFLLKDRDLLNFGTVEQPFVYEFSILDKFSRVDHHIDPVHDDLPTKLWLEKERQNDAARSGVSAGRGNTTGTGGMAAMPPTGFGGGFQSGSGMADDVPLQAVPQTSSTHYHNSGGGDSQSPSRLYGGSNRSLANPLMGSEDNSPEYLNAPASPGMRRRNVSPPMYHQAHHQYTPPPVTHQDIQSNFVL